MVVTVVTVAAVVAVVTVVVVVIVVLVIFRCDHDLHAPRISRGGSVSCYRDRERDG